MAKSTSRRLAWGLGIAGVLLASAGFLLWFLSPAEERQEGASRLSRAESLHLVERKNVGLGSLENLPNDDDNDGSQCIAAFSEIAETLPDGLLGFRNLAITRLILLSRLDPASDNAETIRTAYENAATALQRLQDVEGDTAVVHLLRAELAKQAVEKRLSSDEQRIVAEYAKAAELQPDDFAIFSEWHLAVEHSTDEQLQQQGRDALRRAYELRPENLSVLFAWLIAQAEQHDPEIVETLNAARDTLRPFEQAVRRQNVELSELIDETIATIRSEDQPSPAALKRAYETTPNDPRVVMDWLLGQARMETDDIVQTLENAYRPLEPFEFSFRQQAGLALNQHIEETIVAARQDNWDVVQRNVKMMDQLIKWQFVLRNVRTMHNLIKPQFAHHIDLLRRSRHVLEYVIHDFSSEFYQRADLPPTETPPVIPVKLVPAGEDSAPSAATPLPELNDVRDILLADFNLDSWLDVIVLRATRLEVYGFQPDDEQWRMLAASDVPEGMQRIAAADFDRDHDENYARLPNRVDQPQDAPDGAARPPREGLNGCQDADVDLVVYGSGGARLLKNQIDRETFTRSLDPMPQQEAFESLQNVGAVGIADLEGDGDLDLAVSSGSGITLWSNREDWTFADVSDRSVQPPDSPATDIIPVDFNRDVSIDLLLAGPGLEQPGYMENIRHGRFRWEQFNDRFEELGDELAGAASLAAIEADGNVSWDIVTAGETGLRLVQTEMRPDGALSFLKTAQISESPATAVTTWDYDNDGYQDLLAWSRSRPPDGTSELPEASPPQEGPAEPSGPTGSDAGIAVYRGLPDGRFEPTADLFDPPPQNVTAADVGDLDGDGDLDVAVVEAGRLRWYVNEGGNANHWIDLALRAESDPQQTSQRCNMHGVGSLIELKVGTKYQVRVAARQSTHFGLGELDQADVIRVLWTNGIPQNVMQPNTEQAVCQRQRLLKGSCPYLYTWTGETFEFFTDLLWSSPIGLQRAEGVLAPSREWEYLKIPGEKLVPRNGEYHLQVTEELWEVAYFDSVELLAVDHPADVEIYSNEKVGPAEVAGLKIHTVRHPRRPVAANVGGAGAAFSGGALPRAAAKGRPLKGPVPPTLRDAQRRDVPSQIADRDDVYLKPFERRLKQGLTEQHFLELDLGDLDDPGRITLFLTGWIFPTDTSLNIAISQNPELDPPQPPSLWVPDGQGGWWEAIPYTGFPGGKTKTIAVPIPGDAFPEGDYRLRLQTSMELYWDQVFFTVDEEPAESRTTPAPLIAADLHVRGFSQRIEHPGNGPESYDYKTVVTTPQWPPIDGAFTRFGDVTELVRDTDDRLVIMGAGDEMTLRFDVPESPPEGWKRDFLLHNVGWDKDADLNTVTGQTVEPLPFVEMSRYPYAADEAPPQSPQYQQYLREYQTRRQNDFAFWKQIQRWPKADSR